MLLSMIMCNRKRYCKEIESEVYNNRLAHVLIFIVCLTHFVSNCPTQLICGAQCSKSSEGTAAYAARGYVALVEVVIPKQHWFYGSRHVTHGRRTKGRRAAILGVGKPRGRESQCGMVA